MRCEEHMCNIIDQLCIVVVRSELVAKLVLAFVSVAHAQAIEVYAVWVCYSTRPGSQHQSCSLFTATIANGTSRQIAMMVDMILTQFGNLSMFVLGAVKRTCACLL